jgi:putative NADH-flavin reductase
MLDKIPPAQRVGVDAQTAANRAKDYLRGKDASHIKPHSQGGSSDPRNLKWEDANPNRARGNKPMTRQEQIKLDAKAGFDNISGAFQKGLEAAPKGAVVGAIATAPFSLLRNALRVVRGEISSEEATLETVKETAIGGAVGGATAFTVTAVAAACPPVAMALTAISPALLVVGGAGMVYEFFKILDDHKQQVKQYYESLTQQQLSNLQQIENELIYEHNKNLAFLTEARELSEEITNRPRKAGIEGALERLQESIAIARSIGATESDSRLLSNSNQLYLPQEN